MTDARIGIVKAVLQLTPEQETMDPCRGSDPRQGRRKVQAAGIHDTILRNAPMALAEKAAGLKKLADAWEPLYQSLKPDQKQRMRLLAMRVVDQLRDEPDDWD